MDPIQTFQNHLEDSGVSRNTITGYTRDVHLFSVWFEKQNREPLTAERLTPIDCRLYRQWLIEEGASPATVNRRLASLRSFGAMLMDRGEITHNPALDVRMVGRQKMAPKWLDKLDQAALIRQVERAVNAANTKAGKVRAIRDQAVVVLLINSGLRVSELAALELRDIDIRERGGSLQVRSGKGEKSRSIPLNAAARRVIRLWMQYRPDGPEFKFLSGKRGEGLTSSAIERRVCELGRLAGVEVTPHTLRHSFAKNLIDAGIGIELVAALMGHSSLQTTRIYCIPGEADLERAVAKLDF